MGLLGAGLYLPAAMIRDLLALLTMGQRAGSPALSVAAARYRRAIEMRRVGTKESHNGNGQLALWTDGANGAFEPWRGRMGIDALVRCDHFNAGSIPLRTCLLRQGATWPGGNRWKDGQVRAKKARIHPYCGSGRCTQGKEYAARVAVEWTQPRFKFYRDDTPIQRRARQSFIRSRMDFIPLLDMPPDLPAPEEVSEEIEHATELDRGDVLDIQALVHRG
jgi:hypothetical protein